MICINRIIKSILTSLICFLYYQNAFAGTGGSEFQTMATSVTSYATGYPAMIMLAIGMMIGIVKLMKGEPAFMGWTILSGLIITSFSTILAALVTATI